MEPTLPNWTQEPIARYLDLLDRWSRTHALTSLEKEQRMEELILDSAALLPHLRWVRICPLEARDGAVRIPARRGDDQAARRSS